SHNKGKPNNAEHSVVHQPVTGGTRLQLMQFNNPASTKNESQNMTTLHLRNQSARRLRDAVLLLLTLVLVCLALPSTARAQLPSPAPDGGYPNQNTAEGDGALSSLTTGRLNTATAFAPA